MYVCMYTLCSNNAPPLSLWSIVGFPPFFNPLSPSQNVFFSQFLFRNISGIKTFVFFLAKIALEVSRKGG